MIRKIQEANRLRLPCRELHESVSKRNVEENVPKMKTHQGAAGRFSVNKKGKVRRRRAGHNHMLEKKSPKRKRRLNSGTFARTQDENRLKRLLGER